jgi:nicotinamide-nucleotide amidase
MAAILLAIGDELCLGQTVDTNSAWVSAKLAERGVTTYAHQTVADDRKAIELAIRWAAHHAAVVIVSGGLGPTEDDLTRDALADAMGVELVEDPDALRTLEAFFRERGRPMPQRNRVQALHPRGSVTLPNPNGTAPGLCARLDKAEVFVLPGVPREMRAMVLDTVLPRIEQHHGSGRTILTAKINTFGSGESNIAERLGPLMARDRNPKVGTTVSDGIVSVRLRSEFEDAAASQRELEQTIQEVETAVRPLAFGRDEATLQEAVIALLAQKRATLATAESCTGGLLGGMLTDVPGSSAAYAGGWITYQNALKINELGVEAGVIEAHGAVSEPVVRAMAEAALQRSGATLAASISGIAGPEGGTPDKPVGTVWLGLAWRNDSGNVETDARLTRLPGDRTAVRDRSAKCALQWVRLHLMGESADHLAWLVRPESQHAKA